MVNRGWVGLVCRNRLRMVGGWGGTIGWCWGHMVCWGRRRVVWKGWGMVRYRRWVIRSRSWVIRSRSWVVWSRCGSSLYWSSRRRMRHVDLVSMAVSRASNGDLDMAASEGTAEWDDDHEKKSLHVVS